MRKIEDFEWGPHDGIGFSKSENFIDRVYNIHFEVKESDIVLDIGASVGPFTYTNLHQNAKHFFCFEPDTKSFRWLVKNTLGYPVTQINKMISDSDGLTTKNPSWFSEGYVESMRFKTFIDLYGIDKIDFLKTDCEGCEYDIINDENIEYLLENVRVIVGEWHLETPEKKELFRQFRDIYLPKFKNFWVYSFDGVDIKWDLYNEHFLQYYNQVMFHIQIRD
jgi:FkbM family methyltransferase